MRSTLFILAIMALFVAAVMAGQNANDPDRMMREARKKGQVTTVCLRGKKKNGRCKRATLRVRSADSAEYFEIPQVEDVS